MTISFAQVIGLSNVRVTGERSRKAEYIIATSKVGIRATTNGPPCRIRHMAKA